MLKARGLPDMDEFSKLCPDPKPPVMLTRQGQKANLNDVGYQQREAEQAKRRWAYIVVKSLEPSQIEWDTVKLDDPVMGDLGRRPEGSRLHGDGAEPGLRALPGGQLA